MSAAEGVSRRRVLTGAAWATPVVLIAAGSPPAAASVRNAGSLVATGSGAQSPVWWSLGTLEMLTTRVTVGYAGGDNPVTNIWVRVYYLDAHGVSTAPTIAGGSSVWRMRSNAGTSAPGSLTYWTFDYTGSLAAPTGATTQLVLEKLMYATSGTVPVRIEASGSSVQGSTPVTVTAPQLTVTA